MSWSSGKKKEDLSDNNIDLIESDWEVIHYVLCIFSFGLGTYRYLSLVHEPYTGRKLGSPIMIKFLAQNCKSEFLIQICQKRFQLRNLAL